MKLNFKLWFEKENKKLFGIDPCDLLERVEKTGSLRQAASEINMSYSQAWKLINRLEKSLGYSLLEKHIGGKSGGGSKLTSEAQQLIKAYKGFYDEAAEKLAELSDKWFVNL